MELRSRAAPYRVFPYKTDGGVSEAGGRAAPYGEYFASLEYEPTRIGPWDTSPLLMEVLECDGYVVVSSALELYVPPVPPSDCGRRIDSFCCNTYCRSCSNRCRSVSVVAREISPCKLLIIVSSPRSRRNGHRGMLCFLHTRFNAVDPMPSFLAASGRDKWNVAASSSKLTVLAIDLILLRDTPSKYNRQV